MKRSRNRKQASVAKQALQIAALAPVVAVSRVARIAATGDRSALGKLGAEKATVFTSAATGMMFAGAAAFTKMALVFASAWSPWVGSSYQRTSRIRSTFLDASTDVARSALTPIRKRVVANSKRLGR